MASTVIGLFEERADADAAMKDLKAAGFSDLEMKEAGNTSGLDTDLKGHGVPEGDIKLFMEGIRAGDTLEIAHVSDDKAEQAREIMDRHDALDIHDAYAQRTQTTPTSTTASTMGAAAVGTAAMGTTATAMTPGANLGGETVIPSWKKNWPLASAKFSAAVPASTPASPSAPSPSRSPCAKKK